MSLIGGRWARVVLWRLVVVIRQRGGRALLWMIASGSREQSYAQPFPHPFSMHPLTSYTSDARCSEQPTFSYLKASISSHIFLRKLTMSGTKAKKISQGLHLYTSLIPFIHSWNRSSLMSIHTGPRAVLDAWAVRRNKTWSHFLSKWHSSGKICY